MGAGLVGFGLGAALASPYYGYGYPYGYGGYPYYSTVSYGYPSYSTVGYEDTCWETRRRVVNRWGRVVVRRVLVCEE